MFLGMGLDSVVRVATDERGKMKPEVLEARIQEDLKMVYLFTRSIQMSTG